MISNECWCANLQAAQGRPITYRESEGLVADLTSLAVNMVSCRGIIERSIHTEAHLTVKQVCMTADHLMIFAEGARILPRIGQPDPSHN